MTEYWCPRGDGRLIHSTANGIHETCDGCHGFAVTIWLLDELLVEGAGPHVWQASAQAAADGDPCPQCRRAMAPVAGPAAGGGEFTAQVCRGCELVWVGGDAVGRLPVRQALAPVGATAPGLTHCPMCGAPYEDADQGRCRYCRAAIDQADVPVSGPGLAEDAAQARARPRGTSDWVDDYIDRAAQGTHSL